MITGQDISAAARKYVGRALQHQGRLQALDCIGLVLAVAEDLELRDRAGERILRGDYLSYGNQRTDAFLEDECARRLIELPGLGPGDLRPGTVVTLRIRERLCHGGIVSDLARKVSGATGAAIGIIHAHAGAAKIGEHFLDDAWRRRITGAFRFPGVDYRWQ